MTKERWEWNQRREEGSEQIRLRRGWSPEDVLVGRHKSEERNEGLHAFEACSKSH